VAAVLLGKRHRLPVVITEHFSAFPRRLLSRQKLLKARWAFGQADLVLPVSAALQRSIEQYGIHARFRCLPNVVDTGLFTPPPAPCPPHDPIRILFVGSLILLKGVGFLLDALAQVQRQRQDWCLDLVGDGQDRATFERQAAELGLAPQVTFHGWKTKTEVAGFMRQADLFVLPSLWDNMPCVVVEAMASGLPIVASDVGGIPEMVDAPVIGALAPPGDTGALAAMLLARLGTRPTDRHLIAARAQRFSMAVVGQSLHDIYEEVLV
jgi:glycosyltransferase involved in cell wall biosynthesis